MFGLIMGRNKIRRKEQKPVQPLYLVRVKDDSGEACTGPYPLDLARQTAKEIHISWVKNWHRKGMGNRPRTSIWKLVQVIDCKVEGVDQP